MKLKPIWANRIKQSLVKQINGPMEKAQREFVCELYEIEAEIDNGVLVATVSNEGLCKMADSLIKKGFLKPSVYYCDEVEELLENASEENRNSLILRQMRRVLNERIKNGV